MTRMIIPAAGRGTRLKAEVPKLLFEVNGKSLIQHVMSRHAPYVTSFILVIHPDMEDAVAKHLQDSPWSFELAFQSSATGMLDAILLATDLFTQYGDEHVSISWCDQIGISDTTSKRMHHEVSRLGEFGMVMPTVTKPEPYIHLERASDGRICRILQRREGDNMPRVGENDCGLFALTRKTYLEWLPEFSRSVENGSTTRERNFLPFIPWLSQRATVKTSEIENKSDSVRINTREEADALSKEISSI